MYPCEDMLDILGEILAEGCRLCVSMGDTAKEIEETLREMRRIASGTGIPDIEQYMRLHKEVMEATAWRSGLVQRLDYLDYAFTWAIRAAKLYAPGGDAIQYVESDYVKNPIWDKALRKCMDEGMSEVSAIKAVLKEFCI